MRADSTFTFLEQNASAVFTLLGIIVGAVLTFFFTWLLKGRELKLKLREKILDRRIEANDKIVEFSKSLRKASSLDRPDGEGGIAACPAFLVNRNKFDEWYQHFLKIMSKTSTWLSPALTREMNFMQDYMVNLEKFISLLPQEYYPEFGAMIMNDFIDLSQSIEKLAFNFFVKELPKFRMSDITQWHKYTKKETIDRLNKTKFFRLREESNKWTEAINQKERN